MTDPPLVPDFEPAILMGEQYGLIPEFKKELLLDIVCEWQPVFTSGAIFGAD
jgi:hypothetical protein